MHTQATRINKTPVTWVLVADGGRAQVYEKTNIEKRIPIGGSEGETQYQEKLALALSPIVKMKWESQSADIYEMGRNATGMVQESVGSARHSGEPHIDARKEVKQNFIRKIAGEISKSAAAYEFDRIILVAPSKSLGELRKLLNPQVMNLVVGEIPKDLTNCTSAELTEHVISSKYRT